MGASKNYTFVDWLTKESSVAELTDFLRQNCKSVKPATVQLLFAADQDQGFGVLCPICGIGFIDIVSITQHIHGDHAILVGHHRPEGFSCRVLGCAAQPFPSYRMWKVHTRLAHPMGYVQEQPEVLEPQGFIQADPDEEVHGSDGSASSDDEEILDARLADIETLPDGRKDIRHAATKMVVDMRSVSAMTRVGVRRAMSGADLVLHINNNSLKESVLQYLRERNEEETPEGTHLLRQFDNIHPFKGMLSNEGQISAVKKYYSYITPRTIFIGNRMDQRLGDEGVYREVPVAKTYELVSIIEILTLIVRKPGVMDYLRSLRPSEDGMLSSYTDADQYRRSPFFQRFPFAFQLALYYDDVNSSRSLGPKDVQLGDFFIEILNIPPWLNSMISSIHPVVIANAKDCHGTFENVLGLVVQEICRLENGVQVWANGAFEEIRATLVAVKGDAKAVHEVLGFLSSGARHFCPLCMISRAELHSGEVCFGVRRTRLMHNNQLRLVENNVAFSSNCGVRYRTCLHDSQVFHATDNLVFDLMHDGAHGLIMMTIRLCMKQFIRVEGLFTVDDINFRIAAFNYGKQNFKDRPSLSFSNESLQRADTDHCQKHNAAQTVVLFRALPFLLDAIGENGIPEEHEYLQILLLLSQIYQWAIAPTIPRADIPYLKRLTETFRRSWYILFPNVNPINKFHHFMHLGDNILEMGPQRQYWCFRNEGKNCPIRRHLTTCNNYKNPMKTTLQQSQILQAKVWGTQSADVVKEITFSKRRTAPVRNLPVAPSLLALGFDANTEIGIADVVYILGYEYRVGEFVLYSKTSENENELPRFGKITSVMTPEGDEPVWFAVQAWHTEGLVERFNAYLVSLPCNTPFHLIAQSDLPVHPPISWWQDYSTDGTYLCLKYPVF